MKRDIVYILKEVIDPAELTYSLRSIDKNFPHGRVWCVGGQPEGLTPDGRIVHKQIGTSKWERVRSSLFEVVNNKEITEEFYLFNDDFFVMKPVTGEFINFTDGTLDRRIRKLRERVGDSSYARLLSRARQELVSCGYDTMSFALHMPMLINKTDLIPVISRSENLGFRSMYGNMAQVPYTFHEDVKIYDNETEPDPESDYISTSNSSFQDGIVGKRLREIFTEPSRFEKKGVPPSELYTEEGDDRYA